MLLFWTELHVGILSSQFDSQISLKDLVQNLSIISINYYYYYYYAFGNINTNIKPLWATQCRKPSITGLSSHIFQVFPLFTLTLYNAPCWYLITSRTALFRIMRQCSITAECNDQNWPHFLLQRKSQPHHTVFVNLTIMALPLQMGKGYSNIHLFVNLKEYSNGISEEEKNKMENNSKTVERTHKESTISPGGDSVNFSHCHLENIVFKN